MKKSTIHYLLIFSILSLSACGVFKSSENTIEPEEQAGIKYQDMAPAPPEADVPESLPDMEPELQNIEGGQTGRVIPKPSPRVLVRWTDSGPEQQDYPYDNHGTIRVQKAGSTLNVILMLNDGSSQTLMSTACMATSMPQLDIYAHKVAPETVIPELWIFYSELGNGLKVQVNTVANPSKKLDCTPAMPASIAAQPNGNYYPAFFGSELQFFANDSYQMPPIQSHTFRLF